MNHHVSVTVENRTHTTMPSGRECNFPWDFQSVRNADKFPL